MIARIGPFPAKTPPGTAVAQLSSVRTKLADVGLVTAPLLALLVAACGGASGEAVGRTGGALSSGTIYNFGTLANPGSCMDARGGGTGDGTQIQEWACNGTVAQAYEVVDAGSGSVNLVNPNSNKCIDIASSGTANGTQVRLWDCN